MSANDKVIPVKVALRIRPLVPREKADACTECLRTISGENQVILGKDKAFTYDYVFNQNTPQVDVYETSVRTLLNSLFNGYNTTVLAYGQTGSGKTFTMGSGYLSLCTATNNLLNNGDGNKLQLNLNDSDEIGVIPRVLNDLFTRIEDEQAKNSNLKFTVKVSFVEVYNEEIKDLFNMKPNAEPLNIREENNTIKVVNLSEVGVTNAMSTIQLLEKGSSLRVVGGTAMNDQSSRSHAIFTISLEQKRIDSVNDSEIIKSKFHLVDLAGSERQSKTKAEGIRLKEGININLGLLALGNVISVLGEDNPYNKVKHVPYRESKLTRLLQDSLGGNSHTLMIACVSPADSNMEETLNTLRYADRARKIKNKPIVNVDPQAAELAQLRQQILEMKAHIYQLTGNSNYLVSTSSISTESAATSNALTELNTLRDDNDRLRTENNKLLAELQRLIKTSHITYERLTQVEQEKENHCAKVEEIKAIFSKLMSSLSSKQENEDETSEKFESKLSKSLIEEMQAKLNEYDQLVEKEKTAMMESAEAQDLMNSCDQSEPADKDYALRQAQMQVQLSEYDSELMKKQVLFQKMMENNKSSMMNKESPLGTGLDDLKNKIDALEKEKDELLEVIRNADKKMSEQKRDRLKQLENEVTDLKRKEKEFQRMVKLKEENDKHCEKLRQEIQHIKSERVKLIKQMKTDTDLFRKYKLEKEKEVNQLKALERKRLVEISKLHEGNNRQEAVLRRKNEEISRIQRQLRETSEKQKQVAQKRQETFDNKEKSALGEKLRQWISNELELSVGLAEARINLNKLLEERKETAAELNRLEEKLRDMEEDQNAQPASKRKYMGPPQSMDCTYVTSKDQDPDDQDTDITSPGGKNLSRAQLEQRIERIKEDIECKNVQINEIQQMVIEGDQDDKSKHLFNNVHSLIEAKVLLKHLYNKGVEYLLDLKLKQLQYEITTHGLNIELKDCKKSKETAEEELSKAKKSYNNEINKLTEHYEQRILYALNSALSDPSCPDDERFHLLQDMLKKLEKKMDGHFVEPTLIPAQRSFAKDFQSGEMKRKNKLQREARKTRVITRAPLIEDHENENNENVDSNSLALGNTYTELYSPSSEFKSPIPFNQSNDNVCPTPDDKTKDPDWARTPLRVKRRTVTLSKKVLDRAERHRKSKSSMKSSESPLETVLDVISEIENKSIDV